MGILERHEHEIAGCSGEYISSSPCTASSEPRGKSWKVSGMSHAGMEVFPGFERETDSTFSEDVSANVSPATCS